MKWRLIHPGTPCVDSEAKAFLLKREKFCVAACARFIRINENHGRVWCLEPNSGSSGELSALLLYSNRGLFPVFGENITIPAPDLLNRFPGRVKIHAVQGLRRDTDLLEALMEKQGYFPAEKFDYHLMSLDSGTNLDPCVIAKNSPDGLVMRKPLPEDEDQLFALQAAYEKEEVLPEKSGFDAAHCRLNLKRIISSEHVLVAELGGKVVGKINTSAASFRRYQIGGVYVLPGYRGHGIGLNMTVRFTEFLLADGKGLTLFVKKRNAAAVKIYRKAGFNVLADYRISYY